MAELLPDGRPWAIVHEYDENDRDRNLVFLLPDGTKHRVVGDSGGDNPAGRTMIGDALAAGNTGNRKGARNGKA